MKSDATICLKQSRDLVGRFVIQRLHSRQLKVLSSTKPFARDGPRDAKTAPQLRQTGCDREYSRACRIVPASSAQLFRRPRKEDAPMRSLCGAAEALLTAFGAAPTAVLIPILTLSNPR